MGQTWVSGTKAASSDRKAELETVVYNIHDKKERLFLYIADCCLMLFLT